MNILFFIQHQGVGGVVRQVSVLSDHLHRRGHGVVVVGLHADDDWIAAWDSPVRVLGPLQSNPPRGALSIGPLLASTWRLRRIARAHDVDIVYAYNGNVARLMAWLATRKVRGVTLVWGSQGSSARATERRVGWKVKLPFLLARVTSRSVPLIIANSEAGSRRRSAQGFRAPIIVVRNGVDAKRFAPSAEDRARVRSEWGAGDGPLVGLVARLDRRKGLETFLAAAARVARERPDVRFVVVGEGPPAYRRELEAIASEHGLTVRLLWAGVRDDMPAVYSALDVLCSASEAEGSPNTVVEAMACGVPCIVTDVGDSALLVGDVGTAILPRDPASLARELVALLGRLDSIDRKAIRTSVTERFEVEAMVDSTERALLGVQAG